LMEGRIADTNAAWLSERLTELGFEVARHIAVGDRRADILTLDRRVEIIFPVNNPVIRRSIIESILSVYMKDTVNMRVLNPDGNYTKVGPKPGEAPCNAQAWLISHRGIWHEKARKSPKNK